MPEFVQYIGRFQSARGRFGGLPAWARGIVTILAVPGVVLLALSIVAVGVSILALLLLTVPAYRLLSAVTSTRAARASDSAAVPETRTEFGDVPSAGRKHVDVRVVE
jgi:hypothetical protein